MRDEVWFSLRSVVVGPFAAALLVMSSCGPVGGADPALESGPQPPGSSSVKPSGDVPVMAMPQDEAGESYPLEDGGLLDTGLCIAATKVYAETLPDSSADPADIPLTPINGFTLPTGIGTHETRQIFRTAAAFKTHFGVTAPAGIDWTKEWVLFYTPGAMTQPAAQPKIVRVRLRVASVRVTTTLQQPSGTCSGFPPGTPFALVKFTAPALTTCRVSYYHRTDSGPCPPVPEPGPSCVGRLTDAGINKIVLTRPPDNIDYRSVFATYKGNLLGQAQIARWQRTCASPGNCMPWAVSPLSYLLGHYQSKLTFHFKYFNSSLSNLYTVSPRYNCGEPGTGWCFAESWVAYDIVRTATHGTVDDYRIDEEIEGRGDRPISDSISNLSSLPAVITDNCVLLRKVTTQSIGPTAYTETLLKVYTSW